jgi:small subunit ribosomal protein S6
LLVILDARSTDEEAAALFTQLGENLKALGADVKAVDNWGKRRLAYDIRKQREGTYAVYEVSAEPAMIKEFERQLRLNENVLRFLSTQMPVRRKARPSKTQEPPTGDKVLEEVV